MRRNFGRHTTEVELDLNLYPTESLRLWGNALLDTNDGEINRLYAGGDWRFHDRFRLHANHTYYRGEYWRYPNRFESHSTTLALRTLLWNQDSNYAAEIAVTYDWSDNPESFNGIAEERFTLYRDLDTFELGVSFVNDKKDEDKGIFLQLIPKGFMGFERPFSAADKASRLLERSRYGTSAGEGTQVATEDASSRAPEADAEEAEAEAEAADAP